MITAELVKELREKTGAGMLDCKKALEANNGDINLAINWLREKGIMKAQKKAERIAAEGLADIKIKDDVAAIVEVNSETDFVALNPEFKSLVDSILEVIINNNPNTIEDVLNLTSNGVTISELIASKTSIIGEKLSFRRFVRVTKSSDESFGSYIHMGGKIAVLTLCSKVSPEVAKEVAMHAAAMRPLYLKIENVPSDEIDKEKEVIKEQAINEGKPEEIANKMVMGRIQKYYKEVCLEEQPFIKDDSLSIKQYLQNNGGAIRSMIRYEVGDGLEKRTDNFAEEVTKQIEGK